MHTPISPSPAPLAPGGAAASFSLLRGLAESAKELTAENKRTYMSDYARFVEASGPAAVLEVLAALDAATARAEAAEHKLAVSEYHLDRACQTKACFDQLELNGAISSGDAEELLTRLPRSKRTMPPYDPPKAPAAPSPGRGDGKEVAGE